MPFNINQQNFKNSHSTKCWRKYERIGIIPLLGGVQTLENRIQTLENNSSLACETKDARTL